jgi:galactokinase
VLRQRVDHVVSENERVALAAKAMKQGDIGELGRLFDASHASLKNDYQVTGGELDTLVQAARGVAGCVGARMTGAGFGGSAISIVEQSRVPEFVEEVNRRYEQRIGYRPTFYQSRVGGGVREMTQCVANR